MLSAPVWGEQNFANVFGHLKRSNQANVAEILARSTGGLHLPFFRQQALETLIARIGEEIHGQYLLTFAARPAEMETFRSISVRLKNHPELQVRTRAGYWAMPD
jgi:hypothetical protein